MSSEAKEMKRAGPRGQPSHHPALPTRGETCFTPQDGEPVAFPQASVTLGVVWLEPEVATKGPHMAAWDIRTSTSTCQGLELAPQPSLCST